MNVWDRRFRERAKDPLIEAYNASIGEDRFLGAAEVRASAAYARALCGAGAIEEGERDIILAGLAAVGEKIAGGEDLSRFEDIHSAVEFLLTEAVGEAGRKLHTGRSRNEQVAADERLYLMERLPEAVEIIRTIQAEVIRMAEAYPDVLMTGYTHLQPAQPVLFAHYIMSLFWPLERAKDRLGEALRRASVLPLGSGALAGSTTVAGPGSDAGGAGLRRGERKFHGRGGRPDFHPGRAVRLRRPAARSGPLRRGLGRLCRAGIRRPRIGRRDHDVEQPDAAEEEPRHLRAHPGRVGGGGRAG